MWFPPPNGGSGPHLKTLLTSKEHEGGSRLCRRADHFTTLSRCVRGEEDSATSRVVIALPPFSREKHKCWDRSQTPILWHLAAAAPLPSARDTFSRSFSTCACLLPMRTVPMREPGGKKGLRARAQFKGMNFSHVFDGTFSASSSETISDSNSKNGVSLGCLPFNRGPYSNSTCPMDASTTCNAQKGSLLDDPTHKIAPIGDSVGADEMILFNEC